MRGLESETDLYMPLAAAATELRPSDVEEQLTRSRSLQCMQFAVRRGVEKMNASAWS